VAAWKATNPYVQKMDRWRRLSAAEDPRIRRKPVNHFVSSGAGWNIKPTF